MRQTFFQDQCHEATRVRAAVGMHIDLSTNTNNVQGSEPGRQNNHR